MTTLYWARCSKSITLPHHNSMLLSRSLWSCMWVCMSKAFKYSWVGMKCLEQWDSIYIDKTILNKKHTQGSACGYCYNQCSSLSCTYGNNVPGQVRPEVINHMCGGHTPTFLQVFHSTVSIDTETLLDPWQLPDCGNNHMHSTVALLCFSYLSLQSQLEQKLYKINTVSHKVSAMLSAR